jgi:hypothetical protein
MPFAVCNKGDTETHTKGTKTMNITEKLAKASRIKAKLVKDYGKAPDFAEAMSLYMVMTGDYSIRRTSMPVFLAGEKGAAKFRARIEAGE